VGGGGPDLLRISNDTESDVRVRIYLEPNDMAIAVGTVSFADGKTIVSPANKDISFADAKGKLVDRKTDEKGMLIRAGGSITIERPGSRTFRARWFGPNPSMLVAKDRDGVQFPNMINPGFMIKNYCNRIGTFFNARDPRTVKLMQENPKKWFLYNMHAHGVPINNDNMNSVLVILPSLDDRYVWKSLRNTKHIVIRSSDFNDTTYQLAQFRHLPVIDQNNTYCAPNHFLQKISY
jgi:hypothetical protein